MKVEQGQSLYKSVHLTIQKSPNPFKALRLRVGRIQGVGDRTLSAGGLGAMLGKSEDTIGNWERNSTQPTLNPQEMQLLANIYGCQLSDLAAASKKIAPDVAKSRAQRKKKS